MKSAPAANPTKVRFVDLVEQARSLEPQLTDAVSAVFGRGDYILGESVKLFEEEFAAYCGAAFAIGVDSGFSALELALRAAGVGPGDQVITQANTFIATVGAVIAVGAEPVLVDCDETGAVESERMAAAFSSRTRAAIPVHLFGRAANLADLAAAAQARGIALIEDACQAHGARVDGARVGTTGIAAAFSFYPAKNLGAAGDAGIMITDSAKIDETTRSLRNIGQRVRYMHMDGPPLNRRMDTIQAAVLRVKLPKLDGWNSARQERAGLYRSLLVDLPLRLPESGAPGSHVYHLFVVETPRRDDLQKHLREHGIETGIHYPIPLHLQPCLAEMGHSAGDFPHAERLAAESLSLPMYPELPLEQVEYVAAKVREFFARS